MFWPSEEIQPFVIFYHSLGGLLEVKEVGSKHAKLEWQRPAQTAGWDLNYFEVEKMDSVSNDDNFWQNFSCFEPSYTIGNWKMGLLWKS
jgi:hypothetical protein